MNMKSLPLVLFIAVVVSLCAGCAVNLPFTKRPTFETVEQARSLNAKNEGPISIKWVPASFPDRIDVEGASGFVGGGSRTRVPIGPGLSGRILETLDAAIGVSSTSDKVLTLTIKNAKTNFEYSAGFFNVTPAMDRGSCEIDIDFALGSKHWSQSFHEKVVDPKVGGSSQTGVVEHVWDEIALQVAKNVVEHMRN